MANNYDKYKDFFEGYSKMEVQSTKINWEIIYDRYRAELLELSSNENELANYAVELCYHKYPNKSKNFCWTVLENGLLGNLEKNREVNVMMPMEVSSSDLANDSSENSEVSEYLGRYYKMVSLFMGKREKKLKISKVEPDNDTESDPVFYDGMSMEEYMAIVGDWEDEF
jgi:hypothetical protein